MMLIRGLSGAAYEDKGKLGLCAERKLSVSHSGAGAAYPQLSSDREEPNAALCDSGLPDGDVCNVLLTPSVKKDIIEEAWARG